MANISCVNPTTRDEARQISLALGIPGVICLVLSVIGLVAELLFVCRKKNNFLLRLFVYLTVDVGLNLGAYTFQFLTFPDREVVYYNKVCDVLFTTIQYTLTVEKFFVFSINVILLQKVLYSTNLCSTLQRYTRNIRWSKRTTVLLELGFLIIHFGGPFLVVGISHILAGNPAYWAAWTYCYLPVNEISCNVRTLIYTLEVIVPRGIAIATSILCIITLVFWLVWLWKKYVIRAKIKTVIKEMTLFFTHLIGFCSTWIIVSILQNFHDSESIGIFTYILYPLSHIVTPVSFFVYLCASIQHGKSMSALNSADKYNEDQSTTVPLSNRVSLPTDTAAHAPNFLSPSTAEPSEVTPLIV